MAVPTPAGPGPAQFNQVWVDKYGPKSADHVLVLMPGTIAGSGNFTLAARYLVKHVPDLQVWAIDRRSQALEDTAMFAQTLRGEKSLQEMFDYYLGYLDGATPPTHHTFVNGNSHPYARQWGMQVALQDARAVVLKARNKGQAQGHPRRPLARRLPDHRLRRLGLQRATGPQGHHRHGRDRRRPAGKLRLARLAGRDAGRDRRPQHRQSLRRPARLRDPRDHGSLRRGRRHLRAPGAELAGLDAAGLRAAAPAVQPSGARDHHGPVRPRLRPGHLAGRPCADSHQRRHARRPRATRGRGPTVASRRSPAWPRHSARSPPTASSGTSRGG